MKRIIFRPTNKWIQTKITTLHQQNANTTPHNQELKYFQRKNGYQKTSKT